MTLSSQRYSSLVLLNPADVIRLLKYLAFLARFVMFSFMELKLAFNTFQTKTKRKKERKKQQQRNNQNKYKIICFIGHGIKRQESRF